MTVLAYLKKELNSMCDFVKEYKKLAESDREDLKKWAEEEMRERGIEITT